MTEIDLAARTRAMMPFFLAAAVVTWIDGAPTALTGPGASELADGLGPPVHIVTACNPEGQTLGASRNDQLHARLLRDAERIAAADPGGQVRWWPAVGSSADGLHSELSVAIAGLPRAEAIALGLRHSQLAIFELTEDEQIVVPCVEAVDAASAPRHREEPSLDGLDLGHVVSWWDGHARASTIAGVSLPAPPPRCPTCGSGRVLWTMHGLPLAPPPPWVALAGCIVGEDDTDHECDACGFAW